MNEMMKIRKTPALGIALIAIIMLTGQPAAVAQTHESTTWEGSFEADVFPPVDNWISDGDQDINVAGTIINDNGNNYINRNFTGFYSNIRSLNYVASSWTNGGASFEIRGRYGSGGNYQAILGHIFTTAAPTDSHVYWLTYYIQNGEIEIYNTNDDDPGSAQVSLDTSEFHTYRFTMDGTNWNLYIDDNCTPAGTMTAVPHVPEDWGPGFNGYFGWFWWTFAAGDLDYMRYTDAGAFTPCGGTPGICTPGCAGKDPGSVTADSSTWEAGCYEADTKFGNSGPCWNEIGDHDDIATIVADGPSNNYISGVSTAGIQGGQTLKYVMDADTNGGASYEFRLRVNSGTLLMHASTTTDQSSHHYHWLTTYISTSNITLVNSNNFALGSVVGNTDTNWHTYRLTMDGTTWRLYMDGDQSPVLTLLGHDDSDEGTPYEGHFALYWGESSGVDADLDYLRWTDQGALVPTGVGGGCGSAGTVYDDADFNFDCYVNLKDYQIFAEQFMSCTDPANPACD